MLRKELKMDEKSSSLPDQIKTSIDQLVDEIKFDLENEKERRRKARNKRKALKRKRCK